jgi:isopropylmalate/homocitrate/citramalate synthase
MSVETLEAPLHPGFDYIWNANLIEDGRHPLVGPVLEAVYEQRKNPEAAVSVLYLTDVTLRDGQQQRTNEVTTAERLEVFDEIVKTGVDCIEIGHMGNSNGDQQLAAAIVQHVAKREQTDDQYANVKLQVLFGSQKELMQQGINVLEEAFKNAYGAHWQTVMADKMAIHVYDRIHQKLINTSRNPYTPKESAERVSAAAHQALHAGFKNFSITAEAGTAVPPAEVIQYYRSITQYLFDNGAGSVNVNLANTYGYSANTEWNSGSLAFFDKAVKHGFDNVTTSVHTHNDVDNAVDFATASVVAGFDRVEGTLTGMGERDGNVANIVVVARAIEAARHGVVLGDRASIVAQMTGDVSMRRLIQLNPGITNNLRRWYSAAENISEVFGRHAMYRFRRTSPGNPYGHDNGAGTHDAAMRAAIENPVDNPPHKNYGWSLTVNAILGRPLADLIAIGDPDAIRAITVNNHAAGGSTRDLMEGRLVRASPETIAAAAKEWNDHKAAVLGKLTTGTMLVTP